MHTHKVNTFPPSCGCRQSAASALSRGFVGSSGAVPAAVPHVLVPVHVLQLPPRVGTPGTIPVCPSREVPRVRVEIVRGHHWSCWPLLLGGLAASCRSQPASNRNQIKELEGGIIWRRDGRGGLKSLVLQQLGSRLTRSHRLDEPPSPSSRFLGAFSHAKPGSVAYCTAARNTPRFENSAEHLNTCLTRRRSFKPGLSMPEWFPFNLSL